MMCGGKEAFVAVYISILPTPRRNEPADCQLATSLVFTHIFDGNVFSNLIT